MNEKHKKLMPYIITLIVIFYLLPIAIKNTGLAMIVMLIVIPLLTFMCNLTYGAKQGFDLLIPVLTMVLFAPSIFIFYNSSAWPYILAYGFIAFVGNGLGVILNKNR